ncbi:MAG: hypothetical protein ACLQVI_30575 [Polyangiaceae bacterium]|jgi:hypothetical protein
MRTAPLLFATLALAILLAPRAATAQSADSCVKYWGETRYGAMGYNHIVHVANSCATAADCSVSTDVAPEPLKTEVAGKSQVEVTTFLGSPARTFTPRVKCTMRDK